MSVFDFPRVHVFGAQLVNAGTCNNDSIGPGTEISITSDSARVQPVMHGMDPDTWRTWARSLDQIGLLRCQWNLYGDMTLRLLDAKVVSVQHNPTEVVTSADDDPLIGCQVHLDNAIVCDANPEGFNTTQIFADSLTIRSEGERQSFGGTGRFVSRQPTRAVTRGLNWSRNVSFHGVLGDKTSGGSAGASAGFQCSFEITDADLEGDGDAAIEEFRHHFLAGDSPTVAGLVELFKRDDATRPRGLTFRYNLHLAYPRISDPDLSAAFLRGERPENPAIGLIVGTIAPWYVGEPESGTMGRVLNPTKPISNPYSTSRPYYLGPAVARVDPTTATLAVDLSNTLPADGRDGFPFDLGTITIGQRTPTTAQHDPNQNDSEIVTIGVIDPDRDLARRHGYIYDLDYSSLDAHGRSLLEGGETELVFTTSNEGLLLFEPEHHVLLECECSYLDEPGPGGSYAELIPSLRSPVTSTALQGRSPIIVYRRGRAVTGPMRFKVEQWRMTPSGDPNNFGFYQFPMQLGSAPAVITLNDGWGSVDLIPEHGFPGLRMFRFVPHSQWPQTRPPDQLAWLICAESYVAMRILPYDDYTSLLASGPTFDDIYQQVFMYYDLVLPAMNERLSMNDPTLWDTPTAAKYLKRIVDPGLWATTRYMPRTRDLSSKRRELVLAFCDAVIARHEQAAPKQADFEQGGS